MQELFWTLGSGSGGALASDVSSEFAGNAGWFKIIQVFTKPSLFADVFSFYLANSCLFWKLRRGGLGGGMLMLTYWAKGRQGVQV